jgi:putative DNA primase/helicase
VKIDRDDFAKSMNLHVALSSCVPVESAAALAALGFPVFPVHSITATGQCGCGTDCGRDAGKHPRTARGFLDASGDPNRILSWWHRWPEANVAIATGAVAGVMVLDVDPAHGGLASIAALEERHGELSPTWCVETGGDGLHLWFRSDNTQLRNSAGRVGQGLDVRANGGYAIVPPSRNRSGNHYRWANAWHPTLVDLAAAPEWLVALAQNNPAPKMIPPEASPIGNKVGGNHSQALPDEVVEGARNSTLTSVAGAMRRKGCGESTILAALLVENSARCQPPLSVREVVAIAHSVGRYDPAPAPANLVRRVHARGFVEIVGGKATSR